MDKYHCTKVSFLFTRERERDVLVNTNKVPYV